MRLASLLRRIVPVVGILGILTPLLLSRGTAAPTAAPAAPQGYRSPLDLKLAPGGQLIAVSDRTGPALHFIDPASNKLVRSATLSGKAGFVAWSADGSKAYVALHDRAAVAEVSATDAKVLREIPVGPYPNGVAVAAKSNTLLVTCVGLNNLHVIDLASGKERGRVKLVREPYAVAVSADETTALVSNLLPATPATSPQTTATVSIVNLADLSGVSIPLPPNATSVRQVAISADGKWGYTVHTVGRSMLPATQLDRGWVNTNALSIIDLAAKKHHASLLLDSLSEGASDPWGLALSKDGNTLWISIAGTHQVAKIDLGIVHKGIVGQLPAPQRKYSSPTIWDEVKADPTKREQLVNDLSALYVAGAIQRINLPGKGPRGIDLSADGSRLFVGQYFSGDVLVIDTATAKVTASVSLGAQPPLTEVRRGEQIFHDAHYTFQHWLSCATCHPNNGRVDGLNWDMLNDGIGNPKNNKNLLHAHLTAPMMWLSVREDLDHAVAAGFRFNSQVPTPQDISDTIAYIKSLTPEKSPYRGPDGQLTAKALRGKVIFEDEKVACSDCHSGDLLTRQKRANVGTHGALDHAEEVSFDTPSLVEIWRTAPYLHDGRAVDLHELFTKYNPNDKHGVTSHLNKEQIDDLAEYLLSLD